MGEARGTGTGQAAGPGGRGGPAPRQAPTGSHAADAAASRWGDAAWAVLWALVAAALCAALSPLEPDLVGEGLLLHVAERLTAGELLYRDVVSAAAPLPFEVLALLFGRFGSELVVARAAVLALSALGAACAFGLARAAGAGVLAHLAAAWVAATPALWFPETCRYDAAVVALHLSLAATFAAVGGVRSAVLGACSGILTASVLLTLPAVGLALTATLALSIARVASPGRRLGHAGALLGGAATALAAFAAVYAARGQLAGGAAFLASALASASDPAWGRSVLVSLGETASSLPGVQRLLSDARPGAAVGLAARLLFALPGLALAATLLRRLVAGALPAAVWIHAAALAAWLVHLLALPDWSHLAPLLPLAGAQAVLVVGAGSGAPPSSRARRVGALATVVAVLAGATLAGVGFRSAAGPASFGPRVPLRPVSPALRKPDVPTVIRYVRERTRPGGPILVLGGEPLLYFATESSNPTPYPGPLPELDVPAQRELDGVLAGLQLVVTSELAPSGAAGARRDLPILQRRLERYFRVPDVFRTQPLPWILVLERGADRGATAVDLVEQAAQARRWIRDGDGERLPARRPPPELGVRLNRRPLTFVLGLRGGGLDFDLDLPEGAVFQADLGMAPLRGRRTYWHPRNAELVVSAGRKGRFERLASVRVAGGEGHRALWEPFEVDLAGFGGSRAVLRLELVPGPGEPPVSLGWWGSPRIVSR